MTFRITREQWESAKESELQGWIDAGRPCDTGKGHHTEHADLCPACLPPTARPESLECTRPTPSGDSDGASMTCRHCGGYLCPSGHAHVGEILTLCPLC